jgi:preprotein translocase subunit YajC
MPKTCCAVGCSYHNIMLKKLSLKKNHQIIIFSGFSNEVKNVKNRFFSLTENNNVIGDVLN